jgi:hypothetical protein
MPADIPNPEDYEEKVVISSEPIIEEEVEDKETSTTASWDRLWYKPWYSPPSKRNDNLSKPNSKSSASREPQPPPLDGNFDNIAIYEEMSSIDRGVEQGSPLGINEKGIITTGKSILGLRKGETLGELVRKFEGCYRKSTICE